MIDDPPANPKALRRCSKGLTKPDSSPFSEVKKQLDVMEKSAPNIECYAEPLSGSHFKTAFEKLSDTTQLKAIQRIRWFYLNAQVLLQHPNLNFSCAYF